MWLEVTLPGLHIIWKTNVVLVFWFCLDVKGPVWWQWKDRYDSVCVGSAITAKSHKCSSSGAGGAALGQADVSDDEAVQVMGLQWALEEIDDNEGSVFQLN